jgi:hypothetical protein
MMMLQARFLRRLKSADSARGAKSLSKNKRNKLWRWAMMSAWELKISSKHSARNLSAFPR